MTAGTLETAFETFFAQASLMDDEKYEVAAAEFCERFAISPADLGERIEAMCSRSKAVGAQLKESCRLLEAAETAWIQLDIRRVEAALADRMPTCGAGSTGVNADEDLAIRGGSPCLTVYHAVPPTLMQRLSPAIPRNSCVPQASSSNCDLPIAPAHADAVSDLTG